MNYYALLVKYMARVYAATVDPSTGEGETFVAAHLPGPETMDQEELAELAAIEKEAIKQLEGIER